MKRLFLFGILAITSFFSPLLLFATAKEMPLAVSGWIPYWKEGAATSSIPYLNKLTAISPFSYTVKSDGTLVNPMKTNKEEWDTLFNEARKQGVKIYPSILWTDKNQMESILSYKKKRAAHISEIVAEAKAQNWHIT